MELLPVSSLPRSSLRRTHTTRCVTWPMPVMRWLVSTGPSGPRKLGRSLAECSGAWPGPGTLIFSLHHPRPEHFCSRGRDSWFPTPRGAHSNQGLHQRVLCVLHWGLQVPGSPQPLQHTQQLICFLPAAAHRQGNTSPCKGTWIPALSMHLR